jgi:hypothetical protein
MNVCQPIGMLQCRFPFSCQTSKFFICYCGAGSKGYPIGNNCFTITAGGFAWLGAGAKTAAGYGHFKENEPKKESLVKQLHKELNPIPEPPPRPSLPDFMLEVIGTPHPQPGREHIALLNALEKGHWKENSEQQTAVAKFIQAQMIEKKEWRTTSAKKESKKDKKHQRTLTVQRYLEEN